MTRLIADAQGLEAIFGIEFEDGGEVDATAISKALCQKCNGRGNFVGYTGRIVGKCFACGGTGLSQAAGAPKPTNGAAINVGRIADAFAAAFKNGIKRPKLRLAEFTFSRAPDTGKNAGSIYVKEGERYLGKVTDGQFYPVRECTEDRKAHIIEVAADPSKAAKAYGLRTGTCSCCGRTLTNGVSIDMGIGPICAERFGW